MITSVLLAAKFFDDAYYNNAYYAKVGGVLVEEMNNLETQFLFKIDFSLRVQPEVFEKYEAELVSHANDMGLQRIAFTTDAELFASAISTSSTQLSAQQQATQQQHVTAQEQQLQQMMMAAESHTPMLLQQQQTFVAATTSGETEFQDYSFINPMVWPQEQNFHQEQQQQQKQELTFMETLDPIYSFPPTLPHRVSAYNEQYPTITEPIHDDVMGATLQYVDHKYSSQAMGITDAAAASSNAAYSPHSNGEKHSGLSMMMTEALYYFPPTQDFNFVTASTSSHSQQQQEQLDYLAQYATTTTSGMTYNNNNNNLNRVMSYPEITPSPPPQPPINVHGLPVYDENSVGGPYVKLPSRDGGMISSTCGGMAYLTTASSGIAMALGRPTASDDHQYYTNHYNHNYSTNNSTMQSSHPIAIGGGGSGSNCHQYHHHHQLVPQDNSNGGWSMLSQVLEKSASLSGSA